MFDFNGKTVVVTGASGGMGSILCERLAAKGANLAVCSVDKEGLDRLAESLKKYDIKVVCELVDITNEDEVSAFMAKAAELGSLAGLANLAGLSIPGQIPEFDVNSYDLMMDVNLKGSFLMSKHFANVADDAAIIVNIGSMAAINANGNAPLYCTAKAAVNMFSKALLLQVGKKNIRVSTINPGGADTAFWGTRAVDRTKLMQAEDVVNVIEFVLCSDPCIQIHEISFESFARFN